MTEHWTRQGRQAASEHEEKAVAQEGAEKAYGGLKNTSN